MGTLADLVASRVDGRIARLEPLTVDHAPAVYELGKDPDIWTFMPDVPLDSVEMARARIEKELDQGVPFAIIAQDTGEQAGCISYRAIEPQNESVEVAWVWVGTDFRGQLVAPEAQYLMMMNAFENFGAGRVWMKTDTRNVRSNASLERFGVTLEGVWRRHYRLSDGFIRDSNVYSVIVDEWPALRQKYDEFMSMFEGTESDWRRVASDVFWADAPA